MKFKRPRVLMFGRKKKYATVSQHYYLVQRLDNLTFNLQAMERRIGELEHGSKDVEDRVCEPEKREGSQVHPI